MKRPPRRENELLGKYLKFARPILNGHGLVFKHADQSKAVPDVTWTANRMTSWWEFKHDVGHGIELHGSILQLTNMRRLEAAGYARYVVWAEYAGEKVTHIVLPSSVMLDGRYVPEFNGSRNSWSHDFILRKMMRAHGL